MEVSNLRGVVVCNCYFKIETLVSDLLRKHYTIKVVKQLVLFIGHKYAE